MLIKHRVISGVLVALWGVLTLSAANAAPNTAANPQADRVIEHWTPERRARAIPRDLVIDERGLGYLRNPNGTLEPYGHSIAARGGVHQLSQVGLKPTPMGKPPGTGGGGSDKTAPLISDMDPDGITIVDSHTFTATVTDASGVKSVSFVVKYLNGTTTQSFSASKGASDQWSTTLSGFTDGSWSWQVVAKDNASKGGNTASSGFVSFTVATGGDGGDGGDGGNNNGVITNAQWATPDGTGGTVQTAAGRLFYEMPGNAKWKGPWTGYVCSGTVITDLATDRSIVLTAAHCVYDDANKAFAHNVLFIPNQAETTGAGTDRNCGNDPLGCWVPSFGVVDVEWTNRTFPDNIPWDYAYYVVDGSGAHQPGKETGTSDELEVAAGSLAVSFVTPKVDDGLDDPASEDFTHALGYSYSEDPNFMYCAEDMTTEDVDNWWLPSCGLSGGASGGPWLQPVLDGDGPIISVNSWGYTGSPGMAGPKLSGTSAECLLDIAEGYWASDTTDGNAGITVTETVTECLPQP